MRLFFRRHLHVRPLEASDVDRVRAILDEDAALHTLQAARFEDLARLRAAHREFSVLVDSDRVRALVWHGVSLSVAGASTSSQIDLIAQHVLARRWRFASIVGEQTTVRELWGTLHRRMGPAREVRDTQFMCEARHAPSVPAHPKVRPARASDADRVFPAAVEMFREEVGVDPLAGGAAGAYRARVEELIQASRTYVVTDGERIVFKADVGAVYRDVAQIHGVWTHPDYRGQGLASSAMASVVEMARADHAARITLYVNDFNAAARRAYANAGFEQIGVCATVLL